MTSIAVTFLKNRVAKTFARKNIWKAMQKDLLQSVRASISSASDGTRAWPKQTLDKKLGIRLDWGEKFQKDGKWFCNLVLQLNKDAENPAINEVASKGTHANRAIIQVPMTADGKDLHPEIEISHFALIADEGV